MATGTAAAVTRPRAKREEEEADAATETGTASAVAAGWAPAIASSVAFGLGIFLGTLVQEIELLFVLILLITVALKVADYGLRAWHLHDDGRIDDYERVSLVITAFFYTLGFFLSIQLGVRVGTDALNAFPLPTASDLLLLLGTLLLLVFNAMPAFMSHVAVMMAHLPSYTTARE